MEGIKGFSKDGFGSSLHGLAKDGHLMSLTGRDDYEITSDFHDYQLAKECGVATKLLKGFYKVGKSKETALVFAREFDRRVAEIGEST